MMHRLRALNRLTLWPVVLRHRSLTWLAALGLVLLAASPLWAQSAEIPDVAHEKSFRTTYDAETLSSLPLGENVYALLETTQTELISDRFSSAGLSAGEGARIGGFLGSWSQTRFRIGDIDITDPNGSGTALMFPELLFWQHVRVGTGMFEAGTTAPGLSIDLTPRRPTAQWSATVNGSGSGGSLASQTPGSLIPPIARLRSWGHGGALVSGPLSPRVGIVAGGTWSRSSRFVREVAPTDASELGSGLVQLTYAPSGNAEGRVFGWVQRARVPFEYQRILAAADRTRDRSTHLQTAWESGLTSGPHYRVTAAFTERARANDLDNIPTFSLDRLVDGPIAPLVAMTGDSTTRRWALAGRLIPRPTGDTRHALQYGVDLDYATVRESNLFNGTIGEFLDGVPARAWRIVPSDAQSRRHAATGAAFAQDHITLSPKLTLDASLRIESVSGAADGAANGVRWFSVLPRATFRWALTDLARLSLIAGYRRAANQLNLDLLSYGDPNGSTGTVSRWTGTPLGNATQPSSIIDRIGPGTGGDPTFSRIDADLKRPVTDELVIGVESDREGWLKWGLMGFARRQSNLIGLTDTGVPLSAYSAGTQFDPGQVLDPTAVFDDQQLPVYNRLPATFGNNRYLLTNPDTQAATAYALKLTFQASGQRFFSLFAATASAHYGSAGNRGYGPLENSQDVIGELYTNPNAAGFARGRLFADRAFTIKWTTVYHLPGDLDFGAIARYQDGQSMSRIVIAPSLNQGPEALLAYPNASHRFTFTGTLDLRVRKGVRVGKARFDAVLDAYNLITRSNEVEEYVITGPDFRQSTAIEPTPAVHLGLRFTF